MESQTYLIEYNPIEAKEKKPTYSQVWSAYNKAQTREKIIVYALLDELLANIKLKDIAVEKRPGRPSVSLRDALFSLFIKIYMNKSSRRIISELALARRSGYIGHLPHFNTICNFLNEKHIEPILKDLITMSAICLKDVESHFGVDSTGFSTSMYGRWLNDKTGTGSLQRLYMKCHAMIGCTTNIITSCEITRGTASDTPHLAPLVKNTAHFFCMDKVTADKAYSTRENHRIIEEVGAMPFIPFKKNAIGSPKGYAIWRTMFDFFHGRNAEFKAHYHRRSNAETAFAMIKMKFGGHLKARNEQGQRNEVLLKCLAHNLAVLTQEAFELGIDIDFSSCAEQYIAQKPRK